MNRVMSSNIEITDIFPPPPIHVKPTPPPAPIVPPITPVPLRARFPNRYTGGYDSSTVTEKYKYQTIASVRINTNSATFQTIASVKLSYLNKNSDMTGGTVIASKVYPCCSS